MIMKKKLLILSLCCLMILHSTPSTSACTVITASNSGSTFFGYNEDRLLSQFDQITTIYFHPQSGYNYAYMDVRAEKPDFLSIRVGMNSHGVAVSGNSVSEVQLNPHPEKLYSRQYNSIYQMILQMAANISDAINIINNFDFGPSMAFQMHVSDRDGNAIVVSPGFDGEIVVTLKKDDFLISTNENQINIQNGNYDTRYKMVSPMLENDNSISKNDVKLALNGIHQDNNDAITYYSTIFDLTNGIAYFYLFHNYNEEAIIDVKTELGKGVHGILLTDLFQNGAKILEKGESQFKLRNTLTLVLRILALILALAVLAYLGIKIYKIVKIPTYSNQIKIQEIGKRLIIHIPLILFILINGSLLPSVIFSNFISSQIITKFLSIELIIFILSWVLFLSIAIYQIVKKN